MSFIKLLFNYIILHVISGYYYAFRARPLFWGQYPYTSTYTPLRNVPFCSCGRNYPRLSPSEISRHNWRGDVCSLHPLLREITKYNVTIFARKIETRHDEFPVRCTPDVNVMQSHTYRNHIDEVRQLITSSRNVNVICKFLHTDLLHFRANYCGGCNAEFFDDKGHRVC